MPFVAIVVTTRWCIPKSISQILDSARIEEEFLLVPSATFGEWRGHLLPCCFWVNIDSFCYVLMWFVISNNRGGFAGLLGGFTIAFSIPLNNKHDWQYCRWGPLLSISTGAIIGSTALALLAPGIGSFLAN